MAITLADLRTQSRQRADQEDSTFVTDTELNAYINSSISELHDILIQAYDSDYYLSEYSFSTVSGTAAYALPADFYKCRGVDARINNNNWSAIRKFTFNERNNFEDSGSWSGVEYMRYRIMGSNIRITPVPNSVTTIKLWYIPVATVLEDDADELADLNAYKEYVIVDAAIKMMVKEESDPSILLAQKQQLKRRIEEAANNRDAANAESIKDIYSENLDYYWRNRS